MNRPLRRKDRIMDEENIRRVLEENSHGVLATISEDNTPYANPISYVYHKNCIYFHSASAGHKVDNIALNSSVAFTVVGRVEMKVPKPDAYFESVIAFGKASRVLDFEEQVGAMQALTKIFMPDKVQGVEETIKRLQSAMIVYRIDIDHISGKLRKGSSSDNH
ncbi:MAG: pyridoxamine 5'-phosphate oxidase family protein [Clostridiales bacterium]|nr:pyridoxamine 5'-phosphate oxidase family protein [Clostridiales bacterium]